MRRSVFCAIAGTVIALSVLSFTGCKKKTDEVQTKPAAVEPVPAPAPATTPSGAALPSGVTVDPATGTPKSVRPGPPKVESVEHNTPPPEGSSGGK